MCGIAGAFDLSETTDEEVVRRQLECLVHRGPDSSGIYGKGEAFVGQTRLAVIDLISGDPPITNEDGSVGVALNGEIYNYRDLGRELRVAGHTLRTQGDTEVLAHLAESLEPVALARRLEGMFAFAVWDARRHRLILGRDRMGKKPLYYWSGPGRLVFGSEIKAVAAHPAVTRHLDVEAIPAYLTFGYVPTPRTFFENILSVPPAHVLVVDHRGSARLERYWEPPLVGTGEVEALDVSPAEAAPRVLDLLDGAVRRRLVADVPLGAFLSGGIDSSSVVALMARASTHRVRTFTIGFEDEEGFDERPYAREVARRFGTEHVEFVVKPDAVDLLERLVWHHDQPFGDSSAVPTYLLSKLTRGHVTVALCGDGGDELFAGYERFRAALALSRYQRLPLGIRRRIGRGVSRLPPGSFGGKADRVRRFLARSECEVRDAFRAWVSYVPEECRRALTGSCSDWAIVDWQRKWDATAGADLMDRLLHLTLQTYLLDDLLPKMDRMSMAHGLEVRAPFLDRELVEMAMRLPRAARVRGMTGKRVLRLAVKNLLPAAVLNRPKRGFAVPLDRWFRTDLRPYLQSTLGSPKARVREHLSSEGLDKMLSDHQRGKANHRDALWTLLTLEVFLGREGW